MKTLLKPIAVILAIFLSLIAFNMVKLAIEAESITRQIQSKCISDYISVGIERSDIVLTETSCKLK